MNDFLALAIDEVLMLGAGCNQAGCAGKHPGGSYPGGNAAKGFGKRKPGSTRTTAAHRAALRQQSENDTDRKSADAHERRSNAAQAPYAAAEKAWIKAGKPGGVHNLLKFTEDFIASKKQ